jgi:hypothetical protein
MPFPYAYYKEEYNGPLHGTRLTSPVLFLTTSLIVNSALAATGQVSVAGKSHIFLDSTGSNLVIDNLIDGEDGQVLFIHKNTSANSVTIKHINGSLNRVFTSSESNIVMPAGRYGGTILICRDNGTSKDWFEIVNGGFFGDGLVTAPSIAFASEPLTGIFKHAIGTIGFATSGVGRFFINGSYIRSAQPHRFADGTNASPSITFDSDTDTGFYKATDKIVFSGDGVNRLAFTKTGNLQTAAAVNLLAFDDSTLMRLRTGSLLASDVAADDSLIPVNGIYSKGNVRTGGQFIGTATSSLYADLAERYEADAEYPVGTIVRIGGEKEITIANGFKAFGIISSNPGFKMNSEAGSDQTHPYVALAGRVPCKVIGKVEKGDAISLSTIPGVGIATQFGDGVVIGRALENKDTEEEGLVLVVTRAVI